MFQDLSSDYKRTKIRFPTYWLPKDNHHVLFTTGQNEVSTLGNLNDLSLLDELTNSSTSTGTVNLQTVHNGVDGDQLHLYIM